LRVRLKFSRTSEEKEPLPLRNFKQDKNYWEFTKMNYRNNKNAKTNLPMLSGNVRLILGVVMLFAGLYFGLFSEIKGHGLGLIVSMISPLLILTDDKSETSRFEEASSFNVNDEPTPCCS
jgi:predicted lipid-binding transport protein (Tim44 family)